MPRKVRAKTNRAAKLGDVASMLRANGAASLAANQTSVEVKRTVLADFCRLVGARLVAGANGQPVESLAGNLIHTSTASSSQELPHLSPRMRQTLRLLLEGDSEKQIAQKLRLSQHTIHVYVKALYRGFGVNSRGELMSHFVAAGGSIAELIDPPSLQRATG